MKIYYVYGTANVTSSELRDKVADALDIQFEEHESDYLGGIYYQAGDLRGEHIVILVNSGGDDDDLPYPEFAYMPVILEINDARAEAVEAIQAAIPDLVLLGQREV
jgi:hypothetical protein